MVLYLGPDRAANMLEVAEPFLLGEGDNDA